MLQNLETLKISCHIQTGHFMEEFNQKIALLYKYNFIRKAQPIGTRKFLHLAIILAFSKKKNYENFLLI